MKVNKKTASLLALSVVIFALMCSFYFRIAQRIDINSDMASGIVEAMDMTKGNILLSGWSLSTVSFYFTEIIWYALDILIGGHTYKIAYFMPAVILTVLCVMMIVSSERKKTSVIFTLFLIGSPAFFMARNVLTPFIHVGTYVFCLAAYCFTVRYVNNGCRAALAAVFAILSLAYFSDTVAIYISLAPALVVVAVSFLRYEFDKRWTMILLISLLSVASSALIKFVFSHYGFVVPGVQPTRFATLEGIGKNAGDMFLGIMRLFDADFYGRDPRDSETVMRCLTFFMLAVFIFILTLRAFKMKDGKDIFLLTATLIMPIAFVVSDVSVGVSSIRYILPIFIYGTVFISSGNTPLMNNSRVFWLVAFLAVIPSVHHIKESLHLPKALNGMKGLSQVLKDNGLTNGYAEFWFASAVSVYGQVQVAPVNYEKNKIIRRDWLSKGSWYSENNRFVIIHDDIIKKSAVSSYGEPDNIIRYNGYLVYVWNKKLASVNP